MCKRTLGRHTHGCEVRIRCTNEKSCLQIAKMALTLSNNGCGAVRELQSPGGNMHALAQNLRIALRQLRRVPGFTLTVILTLALGIGATTSIFWLVEGILLRPLPFRDADRLVLLGDHLAGGRSTPVTAREIGTYSNATSAFSSLGGYDTTSYELSGGELPEEVNAARFSPGVFPTLGIDPFLARVFTHHEEHAHPTLPVTIY